MTKKGRAVGKSSRSKKERNFFNKHSQNIFTASLGEMAQMAASRGQDQLTSLAVMTKQVMQSAMNQLKTYPAGAERARGVHRALEYEIEKSKTESPLISRKISCAKGCAFCCHLQVGVTSDEADLLAERVKNGVDIDIALLKAQAAIPDSAGVWYSKPYSESRCVFLGEDNSCRVYEDRPGACRLHLSVDPPDKCDRTTGSVMHNKYVVNMGEMLQSAAMSVAGFKPLPNQLLERLVGKESVN